MRSDRFLLERAFEDCLERIELVPHRFQSALLVGCPDRSWPQRLGQFAAEVDVAEPGAAFAAATGASRIVEDEWTPPQARYDLILALGTLDTVNDLPRALRLLRSAMTADALLIGAISGGDTLPRLRRAMQAADAVAGVASPHVHPRVEASAVAPLLEVAGFERPVVDVDRAQVAYASLRALVTDLRAMAATNILVERSRLPLGRSAFRAASASFGAQDADRTVETFEILHFAAWTPKQH